MKKRILSPPPPTRGILSEIARELGVSRQAIAQRFHKCDPVILDMIGRRERSRRKAREIAIKKYVKAIQ